MDINQEKEHWYKLTLIGDNYNITTNVKMESELEIFDFIRDKQQEGKRYTVLCFDNGNILVNLDKISIIKAERVDK